MATSNAAPSSREKRALARSEAADALLAKKVKVVDNNDNSFSPDTNVVGDIQSLSDDEENALTPRLALRFSPKNEVPTSPPVPPDDDKGSPDSSINSVIPPAIKQTTNVQILASREPHKHPVSIFNHLGKGNSIQSCDRGMQTVPFRGTLSYV